MLYLALLFGFFALFLAVIGLPLLLGGVGSVVGIVHTLLFSGVALLIGLSVARTAKGADDGSLARRAGIVLCLGSIACLAGVVLVTSIGSKGRRSSKRSSAAKATVHVVVPEDGATAVGINGPFEVVIEDGRLVEMDWVQLTLQKLADGSDSLVQGWALTAQVEEVSDRGRRVRLVPRQPLEFDTRYLARFSSQVEVGGRERAVSTEWRFTTQPRMTTIAGVDPSGFSLVINDDDSCRLVVAPDALDSESPARKVVVFGAFGGEDRELARCDLARGRGSTADLVLEGDRLTARYLWVAALDKRNLEVARFPLTGFSDHDGRGVFVLPGSHGKYETPDGVTIHYGRTTWQKFSGKSVPIFEPTILLRVQKLQHGNCLDSKPRGFAAAGCYDISAEWRLTPREDIRPLGDRFWIEYSVPGTMRRKVALMPRFSLTFPAPEFSTVGAAAVAVAERRSGGYVPRLRLAGIGEVIEERGKKRVRMVPGGGEDSLEPGPSGVQIGEMFEGDAMVGRRSVLVADGDPQTVIAVGSGWSRVAMRRVDGTKFAPQATLDPSVVFSTELPFAFHPPTFGDVRKGDGFVLPMVVGTTSLLVSRDPGTGWVLGLNELEIMYPTGWYADVGSLDELDAPDATERRRLDRRLRAWSNSHERY